MSRNAWRSVAFIFVCVYPICYLVTAFILGGWPFNGR